MTRALVFLVLVLVLHSTWLVAADVPGAPGGIHTPPPPLTPPPATPPTRVPITQYEDPTEAPGLTPPELDAFVLRFTTCTECGPLTLQRMASLGDRILGSLEKVCAGDDTFLQMAQRRTAYLRTYARIEPFLTRKIDESEFVNSETATFKRLAAARARELLSAISTPAARNIPCNNATP